MQLTDIRDGSESSESDPSDREAFLESQQTRLFGVLRERARLDSLREDATEREEEAEAGPPTYFVGDRDVSQLQISPAGRWVTFALSDRSEATRTRMTNYVTRSGYAEENYGPAESRRFIAR